MAGQIESVVHLIDGDELEVQDTVDETRRSTSLEQWSRGEFDTPLDLVVGNLQVE